MEMHRASLPTGNFIVVNIMFSVSSAINVAAMVQHKIQSSHMHKDTQDTTDTHIPTTPLSDWLSPTTLVSLSLQRHEKKKKLVIKGQCVFVCIHMRGQREREKMQKERRE